MKKMFKKFIRSNLIKSFLSWMISVYLKICYHSSYWLIKDSENIETLIKKHKSFIVCFWHSRLLMMPFCWKSDKNFYMLISGHSDGQIISKAVSYFGIKTIVGSSFNNKISSYKNIVNAIKSENIVGITPDGPRGPNKKVKSGVISLARLAKVPIIPLTFGAKLNKKINSWDKFLFIFPFNKFIAIWGNPIFCENKKEIEKNKDDLEKELNRISKLADNLCL
tara:strand:+ start:344 stop:1009 length:666 start_codon:yes stop_codon:yes gene_type:complete